MASQVRKLDRVYNLPRSVYKGTAPALKLRNPYYPYKQDVKNGTVFIFHGHRDDKPSEWTVINVIHITHNEYGKQIQHDLNEVKSVRDIVEMVCDRPFRKIARSFLYISENARWRIKE